MNGLVKHGRLSEALAFTRVTRYIDDLLCLDVPLFKEFMYKTREQPLGIYPKRFLTLTLADSGPRVPYMDVALRFERGRGLYTAIYDKRLDPKYDSVQVLRYPDIDSFVSRQAKYGIVTSQMFRFKRICMRFYDFVYNVGLVVFRMEEKGYSQSLTMDKVFAFLRRYPEIYGGRRSKSCWRRRIGSIVRQFRSGALIPGPFGARD